MKIAVTGATGHLGASLLPMLIAHGHQVTVLIREDVRALDAYDLQTVRGNLSDEDSLRELVKGNEVLIHCASKISITNTEVQLLRSINVEGTERIIRLARESGVRRMIYVSSIHAFNQFPFDQPLNETRDYVQDDGFDYDRSKRDATKLVLNAADEHFEVVTLHPTSIIGPPDFKPSLLGSAIINFLSGSIPFATTGGFDFVDVRDVAQAVVNAASMGRSGEKYLLSGKYFPVAELFEMFRRQAGKKSKTMVIPIALARMGLPFERIISKIQKRPPVFTHESMTALETCPRFIDSSKAKKELNYTLRPMEETVADLLNWFRQYGYLAKH
jgi:dihydroflavonol-4-reductase